jgi:hypothetical protein
MNSLISSAQVLNKTLLPQNTALLLLLLLQVATM